MSKMSNVILTAPSALFAQKLAGNEKKIRDRAVKKLKKWISLRSSSSKHSKLCLIFDRGLNLC